MKKSGLKPMPPKPSKTKMRMGAPVAKAAKGGMMGGMNKPAGMMGGKPSGMGKPAGMMGGMGKPAGMMGGIKRVLPARPMPVRGGGGVPVQGPGGRPMKPMRPMPKKPAGM
jgi:hypothetical protein